ncbi:hypothetical protein G6F50_015666 [Rhizopus delemar]|uniref:Uncharacterized protein n=1 Tax=Rhizopus delemar TaxID=936053 RepID=A0A9P6XWH7_9FUNG|nr:hypothetical protein G6F50_015666 [Rhizopus delemar]
MPAWASPTIFATEIGAEFPAIESVPKLVEREGNRAVGGDASRVHAGDGLDCEARDLCREDLLKDDVAGLAIGRETPKRHPQQLVETQRPEGNAQPVFVGVAGVGADLENVRAIAERLAIFAVEIEHDDPRRRKAAFV